MHHEMLTQRALFCHHANTERGTLRQHFVTHVVPPLTESPLTPPSHPGLSGLLLELCWTVPKSPRSACALGPLLPPGTSLCSMPWTPFTRAAITLHRPRVRWSPVGPCSALMNWRHGRKVGGCGVVWISRRFSIFKYFFPFFPEEAKRFEDGLQEQKDFLYIQRKYVSLLNSPSPRST